jgi:preprotein translocase subunit SecY
MSVEPSASNGIQVVRGATYFLALLAAGTGALLASVDSTSPVVTRIAYAAFGLVIAAVWVLWVHQSISRVSVSSAILLVLAFVVPATFVHETFDSTGCVRGVPCDPVPNLHRGLRFGLATVLLFAALVTAAAGWVRSSRSDGGTSPAH